MIRFLMLSSTYSPNPKRYVNFSLFFSYHTSESVLCQKIHCDAAGGSLLLSRFHQLFDVFSDYVILVCAAVWGIMETLNVPSVTLATVRLMPSMAIEPFSTIYRIIPGGAETVYH